MEQMNTTRLALIGDKVGFDYGGKASIGWVKNIQSVDGRVFWKLNACDSKGADSGQPLFGGRWVQISVGAILVKG